LKIKKTGQGGRSGSHEWVYGLNPVFEAIRSGRKIKSVLLSTSRRDLAADLERALIPRGVELKRAESSFFDSRFPKGHQGIAALVETRGYRSLEELMTMPAEKGQPALFLILDCLEDPRNFGAILRVADAGGVHGVVIQAHRSVALSPEAVKASAGAAEYVPVAMVANVKHAMRKMKEDGVAIIGAEAEGGGPVWDLDLRSPVAIVIGSEGKGLRKTVREGCDLLASLPMKGMVNSLNASVAAGIMIFEVMRQRRRAGGISGGI
jgi:23S rRNA (guanosine2251-2'-O)-methyltransferase